VPRFNDRDFIETFTVLVKVPKAFSTDPTKTDTQNRLTLSARKVRYGLFCPYQSSLIITFFFEDIGDEKKKVWVLIRRRFYCSSDLL
jgi:hypothetical protein